MKKNAKKNTKRHANKFKVSFVMPVYNAGEYVAETVDSIVAQTMSFIDDIQIVFVNDGSTDDSASVCGRITDMYPDNVIYIEQENSGVSAARNTGVEHAQGKYISFLDSDDLLSPTAIEEAYNFIEEYHRKIDFVSFKLEFFEGLKGNHPLNYKFFRGGGRENRIIDIREEPDAIHLSGGAIFIKRSVFDGFSFDESVAIAEDMKFAVDVVMQKQAFGVVVNPTYYYRKRVTGDSAMNSATNRMDWYFDTIQNVHQYLIDTHVDEEATLPRYVQHAIMYDLQWRFAQRSQSFLSKEDDRKRYKKSLHKLLQYIDDEVICAQRHINRHMKIFVLSFKKGTSILGSLTEDGVLYRYAGYTIYNRSEGPHQKIAVDFISDADEGIVIEGRYAEVLPGGAQIVHVDQHGKETVVEPVPVSHGTRYFYEEEVFRPYIFKVTVHPAYTSTSEFYVRHPDFHTKLHIHPNRHSKLSSQNKAAYRRVGERTLVRLRMNALEFSERTQLQHAQFEFAYILRELRKVKIRLTIRRLKAILRGSRPAGARAHLWFLIPLKNAGLNMYIVGLRIAYFIAVGLKRREVWIISDRIVSAHDNGEALFRYINSAEGLDLNCFFAISKRSPDYRRMKQYGKVVNREGVYYKLLHLVADKIISSHADDYVLNPYGKHVGRLVDLMKFDFVFLQHGIIMHDFSTWLNRYNKNIKLFVTTVEPEYQSIAFKDAYYYGPDVVKMTGLPRYDYLQNDQKKKIVIMPSWRKQLTGVFDQNAGKYEYNSSFQESEYFRFYNELINEPRLIEKMKELSVSGEFYLHPSHAAQASDFHASTPFKVMSMPYSYRDLLREGDLMVTDYSSVAFDFAYLGKPVVYAQFDHDTIFAMHTFDESYFSYDSHGFGPVVHDYEKTVDAVIASVERKFKNERVYKQRINNFFEHRDTQNSARVVKEILNL